MKKCLWILCSLLIAGSAAAQVLRIGPRTEPADQLFDPLRYVSGTTALPGTHPVWSFSGTDARTIFGGFTAHVTYVSETGPEETRTDTFSTNWMVLGMKQEFGDGFVVVRGRASAEPWTVGDEGYPQMLQYVPGADPALSDSMRPRSFIGELAAHSGWRPTENTLVHLYTAAIGDPALGAAPDGLRASSREFAEAPYAWDIQESFHSANNVVTAGYSTRFFSIEASGFHDASVTEDYTSVDFGGDIDSKSARLTITPSRTWSMQFSRGELGEDLAQRTISSASISWGSEAAAASALWTQREYESGLPTETAYGFELLMKANRHSFMGRAEWVDRPGSFPDAPTAGPLEQTTHFTAGYVYDFLPNPDFRGGIGVNIDYHTQSHELPERYGHKPQAIYAFMRFRD